VESSEIPRIGPALDAIKARSDYRGEWWLRRKDGSVFAAEVIATALPDGNLVGMIRDVTDRQQEQEELRSSKQQLQALVGRMDFAREEEAKRISRDLHDDLGHQLTALKLELSELERKSPGATAQQQNNITRMHTMVDHTVEAVQKIADNLRLGQLDVFGLTAAIDWHLKEFSRRSGIPYRITRLDEVSDLSDTQNTAVFRIMQEALTNIVRHAGATEVDISLQAVLGELTLRVHDNGRGITPVEVNNKGAIGLLGMRERARLIGGEVTITGATGAGTTVLASIPLN
jgi:signal transduction histidine kinase